MTAVTHFSRFVDVILIFKEQCTRKHQNGVRQRKLDVQKQQFQRNRRGREHPPQAEQRRPTEQDSGDRKGLQPSLPGERANQEGNRERKAAQRGLPQKAAGHQGHVHGRNTAPEPAGGRDVGSAQVDRFGGDRRGENQDAGRQADDRRPRHLQAHDKAQPGHRGDGGEEVRTGSRSDKHVGFQKLSVHCQRGSVNFKLGM